MNIQTLSAHQRGRFNPQTNRWDGMNLFSDYVRFCQRRRSYKRKQGKGLTRSVIGLDKRLAKAEQYQEKLLKRQASFPGMPVEEMAGQFATLVLEEMKRQESKKPGILSRFFPNLFNKLFHRKAAEAQ